MSIRTDDDPSHRSDFYIIDKLDSCIMSIGGMRNVFRRNIDM